jgi:hypothetical protein
VADNGSHFFGRGTVHFTPPLRRDGTVDPTAPGAGANWGDVAIPAGVVRMPPGRFIGNAKGLSLRPDLSRANVPDYTGQGTETAETQIVNGVSASLTMFRHDSKNLADWLHAVAASAAGGASNTIHAVGGASIEAGTLLPTDNLVDLTGAIVVTPSWAAAWTENVMWTREAAGIRMLQGFAGPVGGTVTIAYSAEAGAVTHEALQRSHVQVGLVYAGVNRHDNRPVRADIYCAQLAIGEALELINESTAELKLTMELRAVRLAGDTKPRWFRLKWGGVNV